MSYKSQVIEWDIPQSEVQVGIPVGFEVEFSLESSYSPVLYRITTFEEQTASPQGVFFYSTDGGSTWIDFPVGESGQTFYESYKMRLVINSAEFSYIFAEKNGTIYRLRADIKEVINSYTIAAFTTTSFEYDGRDKSLWISGSEETLYKIATQDRLEPGDNSINIYNDPLGIAVDGYRDTFWQINEGTLCLKKLNGQTVFCVAIPSIEVDHSSSSSSS
jgi:hypothetical protein